LAVLAVLGLAFTSYVFFRTCGRERRRNGISLAMRRTTGLHWLFAMPSLAAACVLLFIISNTTDSATINLYLLSDDNPAIVVHSLKSFSILSSISELWDAEMKGVALVVLTFCVVLPYFKILLSLWVFCIPLCTRAHGKIVETLNIIGKWAFLDTFTLMAIISLSSLRIPFRSGVGVAMYVEPQSGLLAYITGTVFSLFIGNILLALHRRSQRAENLVPAVVPPPLCLSHLCCRSRVLATCFFAVGFAASFVMVYKGSITRFCSIEISGLVGWLMKYMRTVGVLDNLGGFGGEMKATSGVATDGIVTFDFSVIGLGMQMGVVSTGIHQWQTIFCQATYFVFALAVPLLFSAVGVLACVRILCMACGSRRIGWSQRHRLKTFWHTLFSWSAVEVYALGAYVIVVQMSVGELIEESPELSEWIRTALKPVFEMKGNRSSVLSMTSSLHRGSVWLITGAGIQLFTGLLFLRSFAWLHSDPKASADDEASSEEEEDAAEDSEEEDAAEGAALLS